MGNHLFRYLVASSISSRFVDGLRPVGIHQPPGGFSLEAARLELARFTAALRATGAEVFEVPTGNFPDDVWVRDPGLALRDQRTREIYWVALRPKDPARRPEVEQITRFVTEQLGLVVLNSIPDDACLEGGDFVPIGETGMVVHHGGPRTTPKGVRWVSDLLRDLGYDPIPMSFTGRAYHSDLALTQIGIDAAHSPVCLANTRFIRDLGPLRERNARILELPDDDWYCVNTVRVNGSLILPRYSARVIELIRAVLPEKGIVVCPMPHLATGDGGSRCACIGIDVHN